MNQPKYTFDIEVHHLKDPEIIVPVIMKFIAPESVVDVGCGTGTFLHVFQKNGVKKILGLDGDWVNRELLYKNVHPDDFKTIDLEKGLKVGEKFDLAICLEVLEHLEAKYSDQMVKELTQLSDIILFSAAIPGQPGQNHVNCQWPEYWIDKFRSCGYSFYDVLRPVFWNNEELSWWYRQNIFLVINDGIDIDLKGIKDLSVPGVKSLVHPGCYMLALQDSSGYSELRDQYYSLLKGKAQFKTYCKMIARYLLRKLSLYK